MDPRLSRLIRRYQDAVAAAVVALEQSGIARPASNDAWSGNGIPQRGALVNGGDYFKHGYGCTVRSSLGVVDFDFGDAGQIDGFDAWRLWRFASENDEDHGFASEAELKETFGAAQAAGELVPSDYILWYVSAERRQ